MDFLIWDTTQNQRMVSLPPSEKKLFFQHTNHKLTVGQEVKITHTQLNKKGVSIHRDELLTHRDVCKPLTTQAN